MAARQPAVLLLVWVILCVCAAVVRADLTVVDLTATAVPGVGPHYQDVVDGIRAFGARDYQTALARLQNAKKVTPALAPGEVMMARLYFDTGQALPGIAMLERAIQTAPQDPEAYVALMERAVVEGRMTEASLLFPVVEKLSEAFNQNPRRKQEVQTRLYTTGAAADEAQQKFAAARTKLEALVKLDQRNATAHERLGRVLFAQNDQKAAYQEFQLAADLDKNAMPAELAMASLFQDKVNSEKWLNFALEKHKGDLRTELAAATYFLRINQPEAARKHAEAAAQLDSNGFDTNLALGLVARMEGDFPKAVKHLSAAHLMQPANFDLMNNLALSLVEMPDEASRLRALQFAEINLRQNPKDANFLATYGWTNYRLNRKPEAERAFKALIEANRMGTALGTAETAYFLANVAKDSGKKEDAIKMLRAALDNAAPFGYRKLAEKLLAELTNGGGNAAENAAKSPATK